MTPILLAGPAVEPVSLADAKAWLRIDTSDEDDLVSALIVSARLTLEAYTRRFFVAQSWRIELDAWPSAMLERSPIELAVPFAPFQGVVAVRVYDASGVAQILPPASYLAAPAPDCGRVVFQTAPLAPGRSSNGIELDVVAGYGDLASDVPEPLRRAILMLAAYWHENRGDQAADGAPLAPGVTALAAPFRRERLL